MLKVDSFEREFTNGQTRPSLIEADDGNKYVLKCINADNNGKALFNELISHRLGKKLCIPMPNLSLIELSTEVINKYDFFGSIEAESGICVGSEYRRGNVSINPIILKKVSNKEDIPGIILFDQIIMNEDRSENDGNLFFDKKTKKILAIDHSHIFGASVLWDYRAISLLAEGSPSVVRNIRGKLYRYCSPYINGNSPFHKISQLISGIEKKDIDEISSDIPEEWMITEQEKIEVSNFIYMQIKNIDGIMLEMKNSFEYWKGES